MIHPGAGAQYARLASDIGKWLQGARPAISDRVRMMLREVVVSPEIGGIRVTGTLPPGGESTAIVVAGTRCSQYPTFTVAA